jgi:hypothetical protein
LNCPVSISRQIEERDGTRPWRRNHRAGHPVEHSHRHQDIGPRFGGAQRRNFAFELGRRFLGL